MPAILGCLPLIPPEPFLKSLLLYYLKSRGFPPEFRRTLGFRQYSPQVSARGYTKAMIDSNFLFSCADILKWGPQSTGMLPRVSDTYLQGARWTLPPNEKSWLVLPPPPNRIINLEIYIAKEGCYSSKVVVQTGFAPLEYFLQSGAC